MYYALSLTPNQELRAFRSYEAAKSCGKGFFVFSTSDGLAETSMTHEELMEAYWLATGFETRIADRVYLCDLIFEAVLKVGLEPTDPEIPEPTSSEPEVSDEQEYSPLEPEPGPILPERKKYFRPQAELRDEDLDAHLPMKLELSPPRFYKYTDRELALFRLLSRRHPKSITYEDAGAIFKDSDHASSAARNVVKCLTRKMTLNADPLYIAQTKRAGKTQVEVFIKERNPKK